MEDTKIQWHPGFVAAMNLEFKENRDDLIFEKEYNLNTKPLETDLLIIKKNPAAALKNEIGAFFRGHNIIEYKSPGDELNINTFYKVQGYACIYKAAGAAGISESDVTVTLIREGKPEGLLEYFAARGFTVDTPSRGIYCIHTGSLFPTQIVVTREIDGDGHVWLKSLSGKLGKEDIKHLLERVCGLTGEFDKEMAYSVLRVSIDANEPLVKKLLEDESMYEALMELMEPKLVLRDKTKLEEGLQQGLQQGQRVTAIRMLDTGKYSLEEISDISGLTLQEIQMLKEN